MDNFTLHMRTKVLFGKGQIANIRGEIPQDARVLITYGGGSVFRNGVINQVQAALEGFTTFTFGGIEPNPAYETLMKAVEVVRREQIDFLLAVGGGSVIDGTKFIGAAAKYTHAADPWELLETDGRFITGGIPLGVVLTLPATGSEMNRGAVISRYGTGDKLEFHSDFELPVFAALDPQVTYSLPPRQTANGVIDAFVHVAEQYMTYPVQAKIQDRFAEGIMLTLIEEGPKALQTPEDYDVRANIMWSATMALNELIRCGVPQDWVSHTMGHEMTALYGMDHGRTLAILLPAVWQYEREAKKEKLLQYAKRVWNISSGTEQEQIDDAIEATRDFFERMGAPTYFSDYGLDDAGIPTMVHKLMEHDKFNQGERGSINPEDMEKIYRMCL